jgi:hypothetical protein
MNKTKTVSLSIGRKALLRISGMALLAVAASGLLSIGLKGKTILAQDHHATGFISIEVHKGGDDTGVTGEFLFTISHPSGGYSRTVAVMAGASSLAIEVPAGTVRITEAARAGFELSEVTAASGGGENRLVSSDLAARTATVTVVAGDESFQTLARFHNRLPAPKSARHQLGGCSFETLIPLNTLSLLGFARHRPDVFNGSGGLPDASGWLRDSETALSSKASTSSRLG